MARDPDDPARDEPLRGPGHLDDLELDLVRAGEGCAEAAAHAGSCARCREALDALRALQRDLAAEARALEAELGPVPAEVDRAVLARAAADLSRRGALRRAASRRVSSSRWLRSGWLRSGWLGSRWTAAAALLLVASGLALFVLEGGGGVLGDVDGDGRVDIVDAYALALHIQSGGTPRPAWDQNGDGVVDERDVDALARQSVSLARWREPGWRGQ